MIMGFGRHSIRTKLMLSFLLCSVTVMLLMRLAFVTYEYLAFREHTQRELSTIGRVLAANSTAALAFENREDASEVLSALRAQPNISAAALYDSKGGLFASYPGTLPLSGLPSTIGSGGLAFGRSELAGFLPVEEDGRRLGTLYLRYDTGAVMAAWLGGILRITLVVMSMVLLVALGLSHWLQRQISRPILALAQTATAVSERRDYTVRASGNEGGELGLLTDAFNQLLAQIDAQKSALDQHAIVAVTDAAGRITYVNDKFCSISKYTRDELMGRDHRIVNSGHHSKEFIRELWATISKGRVWKGEIKNCAKNGSYYWVDTTIVPFLDHRGKPLEYVAIRTDITERKRVEDEIRALNQTLELRVADRTAQLTLVNQELEAFSYSVSHDLRAPLRHVDGFAGLLVKGEGAALSEKSRRYLGQITEAARQMGRLIDDLLVFSRMARASMAFSLVDMNHLVDEGIRQLQPEIQNRRIEWIKAPLPAVPGDQSMLRQVFANLLGNAVKYSRPRDPAIIEIGCMQDSSDEAVIFVRDNGVGFEMEYADKLFGVFQRLHRAEEFEGTGIGLANVRRIVTRHGGRVWAESKPDQGATFYFTLSKKTKETP
jgi:PAS domain S-box-containing protein